MEQLKSKEFLDLDNPDDVDWLYEYAKNAYEINVDLLEACENFVFLEKTNMTKKQVQLRIDIAKDVIKKAKGE